MPPNGGGWATMTSRERKPMSLGVMVSLDAVNTFVRAVAEPRLNGMFNPWGQDCTTDIRPRGFLDRQVRLAWHLGLETPRVAVIGEAPGYQGCRYSGVAFTSERLLIDGSIPRVPTTGRITTRPLPWSEPSATIVWRVLYELGLAESAVLWNAVPWHPIGSGGIHSNRPPTPVEAAAGLPFLESLLAIYPGTNVVAVGNTADASLSRLGVRHARIRHPANGGATKFRDGLRAIYSGGAVPAADGDN